jgi:4-hydroxy-tetrahydrodipicolinate synthase
MKKFQGTGVAMTTAFFDNDGLDLSGVSKLTNHLIAGGVDFLVVLGTTGETATLSPKEQEFVVEMVMQAADGRLPIVLGVGGNDTSQVIAKAKDWSGRHKPAAILSVSPYYSKPSHRRCCHRADHSLQCPCPHRQQYDERDHAAPRPCIPPHRGHEGG